MFRLQAHLEEQLVAPITPVLGQSLVAIEYAVVSGELPEDWAADPSLCIGFGPVFHFSSGRSLAFLSIEGPLWHDRFTVSSSLEPLRTSDPLLCVPASHAVWGRDAIGQVFTAASVRGWASSPHVVRLSFGSLSLVVTNGTSADLGETDDILLATDPGAILITASETLWASGPGA